MMVIGERLKALRELKKMSQGDIETRTGLLRVYISRIENGHSVPSIETLEKFARALGVPLYQIFYDGPKPPAPSPQNTDGGWGSSGRNARTLRKFLHLLGRASQQDRNFLLLVAQKMSQRKKRSGGRKSRGF
jgi:transcriptional regulator with XRE-family HTH domain